METLTTKTFFFADFELNSAKRLLLKNGQAVPINSKAFDLLLLLIANQGRILDKEELLEKVWANQFVEENNLTVHISALRKIFGERKGEHQFIVTIPGTGYKFVHDVRSPVDEKAAPRNFVADSNVVPRGNSNLNRSNERDAENNALLLTAPNQRDVGESIIGRTREMAEINYLLRQDEINLITLTGAGGTGKTSLAQAVTAELKADFPDGVFFVELAAATDLQLVVAAVAQTLEVMESSGKSLIESVKEFLRARRALLVLDNFEQVLSAAPFVKELLAAAPSLKILVTSRAALRLSVEREFLVTPLDLPPQNSLLLFEELAEYPAIELFCKRAQIVKSYFHLTPENISVVAEICRRLDGLPLAIELAAARIKLLAPGAILDRLKNSLKLLTGGAKDSPERQRTMRDTVRWSYDLLDKDEQILFRRLAVFAGGFSISAAEAIAEGEAIIQIELRDSATQNGILDLLSSLVDNNLLVSREQADGNARLQMLEVVREFALECLENSDEAKLVRQDHAKFFLALAAQAELYLTGAQSIDWLEKLETEHDNLRLALRHLLEREPEKGAQMAASLGEFWTTRNYLTEARGWFEAALSKNDAPPIETHFKLLNSLALIARHQGDLAATRRASEESLAVSRAAGDLPRISASCNALAALEIQEDNLAAAQKLQKESLKISRELGDEKQIALTLSGLSNLFLADGKPSAARPLIEESLIISRRLGFKVNVNINLINLGIVAYYEDNAEMADRHFSESLTIAQETGNKILVSCCLDGLAAVAAMRENAEQSTKLMGAADSLRESIGYEIEITERLLRDDYLTKVRCSALDEKTFEALYAEGKEMNLNEAVALAVNRQLPKKNQSASGDFMDGVLFSNEGQSEIIIENHSFSRIVVEEEIKTLPNRESAKRLLPKKRIFALWAIGFLIIAGIGIWFFSNVWR